MRFTILAGTAAATALLAAAPAAALSLVVENASFETLPAGGLPHCNGMGTGCYSSGYDGVGIPGWYGNLTAGQFQPLTPQLNYIPDGATVAYSNGGTITQTIAATAVAGQTYTLRVDLGFRKDVNNLGGAAFAVGQLYGPGTAVATPVSAPTQNTGDWITYTARYTATVADAGAPITIVLGSAGIQAVFDNVRFDTTPAVPEPAAWSLLIAGFAMTGAAMRRQGSPVQEAF